MKKHINYKILLVMVISTIGLMAETKISQKSTTTISEDNSWKGPVSSHITPYDFPGKSNNERTKRMKNLIGNKIPYRLSVFYTEAELNSGVIHEDFNIPENVIQTCDTRHQYFLDNPGVSTAGLNNAKNYFYTFNKRVYLDYCLDLNDTLDWIALQGAILNADYSPENTKKLTVAIPANKTFHINQVLVLKPHTRMVWQSNGSQTTFSAKGHIGKRPGASFFKFIPNLEPIADINYTNTRKTNYSLGTVLSVSTGEKDGGFLPYSGVSFSVKESIRRCMYNDERGKALRRPCNEAIAKNITLYYPHIDAYNKLGENGISFGQGTSNINIYGGYIKNVRVNTADKGPATAGGKAIQCEGGCKDLFIYGLRIENASVGINSNVRSSHRHLNPFDDNDFESQINVYGLYMKNVDTPINVYNTYKKQTIHPKQEVNVENFTFVNSGKGMANKNNIRYDDKNIHKGKVNIYENPMTHRRGPYACYGGILASGNGKNISLKNGELKNTLTYQGVNAYIIMPDVNYDKPTLKDITYSSKQFNIKIKNCK